MGSSAPLQFSDNSSHLVFWHQIFDTTMMYLNRFDPQPTYKWIISATLLLSMVTILVIETSVPRDRRRLPGAKYTPSSFEHAYIAVKNRKAGTIPSQGHNYFGAPELQGDAFVTPDNTTCKRRGSNKVPSLDDLDLERSGFVECGSAKCQMDINQSSARSMILELYLAGLPSQSVRTSTMGSTIVTPSVSMPKTPCRFQDHFTELICVN